MKVFATTLAALAITLTLRPARISASEAMTDDTAQNEVSPETNYTTEIDGIRQVASAMLEELRRMNNVNEPNKLHRRSGRRAHDPFGQVYNSNDEQVALIMKQKNYVEASNKPSTSRKRKNDASNRCKLIKMKKRKSHVDIDRQKLSSGNTAESPMSAATSSVHSESSIVPKQEQQEPEDAQYMQTHGQKEIKRASLHSDNRQSEQQFEDTYSEVESVAGPSNIHNVTVNDGIQHIPIRKGVIYIAKDDHTLGLPNFDQCKHGATAMKIEPMPRFIPRKVHINRVTATNCNKSFGVNSGNTFMPIKPADGNVLANYPLRK